MTNLIYFLITISLGITGISIVCAENPTGQEAKPDGKIGIFKQTNSADCFFLASLLALANDPDGKSIVESAIGKTSEPEEWKIIFPNWKDTPTTVNIQEVSSYKLSNIEGVLQGNLVTGDPDIQMFEIAADKAWRIRKIKPLGLWDDVSMNALAMFSDSSQQLIWNKKQASPIAVQDIEKYKRLPKGTVLDRQVSSYEDAEKMIRSISELDTDGITMILMDYMQYHGVAIVDLDFETMKYSFIDSVKGTENLLTADLKILLERVAHGKYALNYMEIAKDGTPKHGDGLKQ